MRRMVTLGLLVIFLGMLLVPTLRGYLGQRSEINSLNDQVTKQQSTVKSLQKQRDQWNDPTYVAQQARSRLGFAKPGEKAYIIVDDNGTKRQVQARSGVRKDASGAQRPWYGHLWGSVVSAGDAK
jgi:cell division protein FtsB